jgi:hypothetical protein
MVMAGRLVVATSSFTSIYSCKLLRVKLVNGNNMLHSRCSKFAPNKAIKLVIYIVGKVIDWWENRSYQIRWTLKIAYLIPFITNKFNLIDTLNS